MADVVFLKKLTGKSDLGWFKAIHKGRALDTNQKGINLNKPQLYEFFGDMRGREAEYDRQNDIADAALEAAVADPVAARIARDFARVAGHVPVRVSITGPGGAGAILDDSLIAIQDKNWRLGGAYIDDPPGQAGRFDPLVDGDLALIGFSGTEWPTYADVVLLAAAVPLDAPLVASLSPLVNRGSKSMVRLEPDYLHELADGNGLPADHPIWALSLDPAIRVAMEEAAQGDPGAVTRVRRRRRSRVQMTPEQLAAGLAAAGRIGRLGEAMVAELLRGRGAAFRWMADEFASHPYDFELHDPTGATASVIDAKTTSGPWTGNFYVSEGEIDYAADSAVPYRIFRVSDASDGGAMLRISDDIRTFAQQARNAYGAAAPPGTRASTIAVSPETSGITWSPPIRLLPLTSTP